MASQTSPRDTCLINGDIIGDDTLFPWESYPIDWSVDDLVWGYGAPVSALTINDNQFRLTISPGVLPKITSAHEITPPTWAIVTLLPDLAYYTIDNQIETTEAKTKTLIGIDRAVGSHTLRLYGTIAADSAPDVEEIAIDDPADYAAMALRASLVARGVAVTGKAIARHKLAVDTRAFLEESREPLPEISDRPGPGIVPCLRCKANQPTVDVLASHRSATVAEDVVVTNKVSQNLHAELLLHQLSIAFSDDPSAGSTAQGARVIRQFAINAGVDPDDFIFFDGSGMSGHDLVTPRAIAKLLQFASTQPWFADYKASLPIGGVDGSLEHRFTAPPLKGHVFAKTGTLGEARSLSGYLECASGKTVIFSILVGNHSPTTSADREVMDKIVAAIAASE
jgi:D-alanyl-D-alanine carboxypeptidase/D-alanyl-D-alanine-endopeptidase (penicillin-binding protein 4)